MECRSSRSIWTLVLKIGFQLLIHGIWYFCLALKSFILRSLVYILCCLLENYDYLRFLLLFFGSNVSLVSVLTNWICHSMNLTRSCGICFHWPSENVRKDSVLRRILTVDRCVIVIGVLALGCYFFLLVTFSLGFV